MYVVLILVFVQEGKKTHKELLHNKKMLQRNCTDLVSIDCRDPENEGIVLTQANWKDITPYAGTFVIVRDDTEPEGRFATYLGHCYCEYLSVCCQL